MADVERTGDKIVTSKVMKMKAWFLPVVASLSAGVVLAQESNSVPAATLPSTSTPAVPPAAVAPAVPAAPAPSLSAPAPVETVAPTVAPATNEVTAATNAPAKKVVKKKKAAPQIATHQLLTPSVEATVKVQNLNVRTLPSTDAELIAKLHKGQTVTILEDITTKGKKGEATNWARITLPTNAAVWVKASLVNSSKTVTSPRINIRSGPGENFAILGHLEKGAVVKDLRKQKDWLEIEAPADASAFVSADYLEKTTAAPAVTTPAPETTTPTATAPSTTNAPEAALPAPTTEVVNVAPDTNGTVMPAVDATAPATTPAPETSEIQSSGLRGTFQPVPAPAAEMPKDEIIPKRIVNREGFLRKSMNIQAPADYELHDVRTGELIDYISPLKPELDLTPFIGTRVIVSGEEAVDVRWKYIPMIKVETVDSL